MRDRITVWLGVFGVLAVVVAVVLAALALWPRADDVSAAPATPRSHPFVSTAGGFSVRVPQGVQVRRDGPTARFSVPDRSVVVAVGPAGPGPAPAAAQRLVERVRASYAQVRVLGRRTNRVDGRRALTTYGKASSDGVALRFAVVVVAAKPHPYALTTFTSADSEPRTVVPVVDALTRSFHVLPARTR